MAVKLIVGLGNPGPKYLWTRHNAGFMVIDRLAAMSGISVARKNFAGLSGEGAYAGSRLLLLKPQTFMNLSGRSVAAALRFHKLSLQDLVVIHDELDVPYGRLKVKEGGGHAGHNGLRSLVQELGGNDFVRLRVGIGRPVHGDVVNYVLTNFSAEEMAALPSVLDGAIDCLGLLLREGVSSAMSQYNNRELT